MTITVYKIANTAIRTIQDWFLSNYGVAISRPSACQFSIHTMDFYGEDMAKKTKRKILPITKKILITIDDRYKTKVMSLTNEYRMTLEGDSALAMTSVIVARAATLPLVYDKPQLKFVYRPKAIGSEGYIPKFSDLIQGIPLEDYIR